MADRFPGIRENCGDRSQMSGAVGRGRPEFKSEEMACAVRRRVTERMFEFRGRKSRQLEAGN